MAGFEPTADCTEQDIGHPLLPEIDALASRIHHKLDCLEQDGLASLDQAKLELITNVQNMKTELDKSLQESREQWISEMSAAQGGRTRIERLRELAGMFNNAIAADAEQQAS